MVTLSFRISAIALLVLYLTGATCLDLDVDTEASIQQAATKLTKGLYAYHNAASTEGQFDEPETWFWWISGASWTSLIDYTMYTGDKTYESDILSSIVQNIGANYDFVPSSQAGWEANDDQVYWVYSALTAMEYNFTALPCETSTTNTVGKCANSWQALAVHAFDDFVTRWNKDSATCGGGLKWQYNPQGTGQASGAYYKNTVSNGGFFQVAARLARYTGNQEYADWANRIWDWSTSVGLVSADFHVFDGTSDGDGANCSSVNHDEWSYNIATYLIGAAHMYAHSKGSSEWETRVHGLVQAANTTFFHPMANASGIMYEQMCEKAGTCSTDQSSFKGSLANWMGKTAMLVPSVREDIMSLLKTSAQGAAASCCGLDNGTCGVKWYIDGFDGQVGIGQELSALEVVQALLASRAPKLAVL